MSKSMCYNANMNTTPCLEINKLPVGVVDSGGLIDLEKLWEF